MEGESGFSLFTRNEEGMRTVQKEEIQRVIVKREENSYKGDFGRLLLIGELTPMEELIIMAAPCCGS